jgi:1,4-alpha-glucan branching enzyme
MSFISRVNKIAQSVQAGLRKTAERQVTAANERARKRMAAATTRAEKLQAKAVADREKAKIYRELAEAQKAAANAAMAVKTARREAGDLTAMERIQKTGSSFRSGLKTLQREINSLQKPAPLKRKKTTGTRKVTRKVSRTVSRTSTRKKLVKSRTRR